MGISCVGIIRVAIFWVGAFLGSSCPGGNFPGGSFPGGSFPGWEFSRWEFSWVGVVQVGLFLDGNFLWWKFSGWELFGGNHPGGNFPGGSFHATAHGKRESRQLLLVQKSSIKDVWQGSKYVSGWNIKRKKLCFLKLVPQYQVIWDKVFKSGLSTFCGRQPLNVEADKFFKCCLPQNLLSPLLNALSHLSCLIFNVADIQY